MIVVDIFLSLEIPFVVECKINKMKKVIFCERSFKLNELLSFGKLCIELDSVNVFRMTCFVLYILIYFRICEKNWKRSNYNFGTKIHYLQFSLFLDILFHRRRYFTLRKFNFKKQTKDLYELFFSLNIPKGVYKVCQTKFLFSLIL